MNRKGFEREPRRRRLRAGAALVLACCAASARSDPLPAQNLRVEWRWGRTAEPAAAPPSGIDAAYVVGTRRGPGPSQPVRQVIVANGATAVVTLGERLTQPAVDYAVKLPAPPPSPTSTPAPPVVQPVARARTSQADAFGANPLFGTGAEVFAAPHDTWIDRRRSFEVGVRWPGGAQPVRLRIRATLPDSQAEPQTQGEIDTTLDVPLGSWRAVAIGAQERDTEPGAVVAATRRIDRARAYELQLRVTFAR